MVRFSVLIPVYNGANFLNESLQSIADQTLDNILVIVSDNASTDDTAQILESWKNRLNIQVVTQAKTLPMQDHFNAVLDLVETEFYMLLCHDDYLANPNAIQLAQDALSDAPDIAAVYCDLVYVNEKRRRLASRVFPRGSLFSANDAGRKTLSSARNQFGIPIGVRRSKLGDLRYDPQFHYAMDVDLSWALSRNETALHIPKPLIANRYGQTNMTWKLLKSSLNEFKKLSAKYDVKISMLGHLKLRLVTFLVGQQKRLFGVYVRLITRWDK